VPPFFPELKEKLKSFPPFWRDTKLHTNIRSYYFYRDIGETTKNEAWALGGSLDYRSGWWKNRFQVGAVGYTSQKLYGPEDRDGTLLLKPEQKSFSVLGQAYLRLRCHEDIDLTLFRQSFSLPYLNAQDSRMVPNTFEGYVLGGRSVHNMDFIVGHVTKMKTRNSTDFEYMSEVAGYPGTDKGLSLGGARYSFTENINAGAINFYAWDLYNTIYAEANGTWELRDGLAMLLSVQYTDQRSVGDELDGDFHTSVFGGKGAISYKGGILNLAFSSTGSDTGIRSPFGGYPGYLSLMEKDFNRADEDAWLVGVSYDFGFVGLPGLSFFANYASGSTPDSGVNRSPDQEEFDLTLDYRFQKGPLKGLWLRFRGAFVDQEGPGAQDIDHFRIILNYDIPVL
jgi:hypothetical protein